MKVRIRIADCGLRVMTSIILLIRNAQSEIRNGERVVTSIIPLPDR